MLDWLLNIQYFCRRKLSRSAIWDASPHATGMSMLYRSKWRQQALVTPRRPYRTINLPCLAQAWPDCHSPESFQPTGQIGKGGGSDGLEETPSQIRNHLCNVFLETEGCVTTHCSKSIQSFRGVGLYQHLPDSLQTGPRHGAPHLQLSILICTCDEKPPEGNPVSTTELSSLREGLLLLMRMFHWKLPHKLILPNRVFKFPENLCFWSRLETTVAPKNLKATTDWRNNKKI